MERNADLWEVRIALALWLSTFLTKSLMRLSCRRRLAQVWAGFEAIEWFGHDESVLDTAPAWQWTNQPVIVLRKKP